MKKSDLLKYLNDCKDLELSIYTQQQEVSRLNNHARTLGHHYTINEPAKLEEANFSRFYLGRYDYCESNYAVIISLIIAVIAGIMEFFRSDDFILISLFSAGIAICIIFFTFYFVVGRFLSYIYHLVIYQLYGKDKLNKKYKKEHKKAMAEYNKRVKADNERVEKELQQAKMIYDRINSINCQITETQSALNKLYDVGVIYPKYRALVPVVMFCEYIESKRCSQLEGHEGAYNIYEDELRQNLIISKLNDVIKQLEKIQENQWMLYEAIERGNQKVNQLCAIGIENAKSFKRIEEHEAVRAENERINAQNIQAIKDIEVYKMLWK